MLGVLGYHGREESKLLSLLKHWEITSPSRNGLEVRWPAYRLFQWLTRCRQMHVILPG